jgi:hypothetical protein
MKAKSIFISHAVANKDLADKIVDLLETGIGVKDTDIFCSSLEGLGVPPGSNFIDFIRQQIEEPKIVILLLTTQYFKSQFCLCELGASWVLSHNVIPLLVKPLEYKDMKAVLTGIQGLKIEDKSDLNMMQDQIVNVLSMKGKAYARWEIKRDQFLAKLTECESLKKVEKPVTEEECKKLQQQYKDAIKEIEDAEKIIGDCSLPD